MSVRVAAMEIPAVWNAPGEVFQHVKDLLSGHDDLDLVLLPEACVTGYVSPELTFDLSAFSQTRDGPTCRRYQDLARKHDTIVVGPLIERAAGACFNSFVGFDAQGREVLHYRKRHPWYPEHWATPGDASLPLVTIDNVTLTLAICFDIHFLENESSEQLQAADVLLFPSAWVDGEDSKTQILRSLASSFSLTIVNANWGAGQPIIPGQGGSMIIDETGSTVATVEQAPGLCSTTVER